VHFKEFSSVYYHRLSNTQYTTLFVHSALRSFCRNLQYWSIERDNVVCTRPEVMVRIHWPLKTFSFMIQFTGLATWLLEVIQFHRRQLDSGDPFSSHSGCKKMERYVQGSTLCKAPLYLSAKTLNSFCISWADQFTYSPQSNFYPNIRKALHTRSIIWQVHRILRRK
jgi:hypothetical protein